VATNKSAQKNQYAWSTPPPTQATTNLQNMVNQGGDYATPIRNAYARAEKSYNNSFKNPLGAYTTADVRDKSIRAHTQGMQQNMGMDLANAAQQNEQARFGRQATVAGLTSPISQLIKTSQPWSGGDTAGLIANGAMGAMM